MVEVLICGGGPAGAVAALSPGTPRGARARRRSRDVSPEQALWRHAEPRRAGTPGRTRASPTASCARACLSRGMTVEGEGIAVVADYPRGLTGLAITRRDLDAILLDAAAAAGANVQTGVRVIAPLIDEEASSAGRSRRGARHSAGTVSACRRPSRLPRTAGGRRWRWPSACRVTPPRPGVGPSAGTSKAWTAWARAGRCTSGAGGMSAWLRFRAAWPTRASSARRPGHAGPSRVPAEGHRRRPRAGAAVRPSAAGVARRQPRAPGRGRAGPPARRGCCSRVMRPGSSTP